MAPTAFPIKLWNVVNSKNELISWAENGQSILVNESRFDSIVSKRLPNFLRTPSLFSLRRSFRWYNFAYSENTGHGLSRYWHPYFVRDREDLLSKVTPGKKRSLLKSWLANGIGTGLCNHDDEYSSDMQLSAVARTSGESILPRSFRQKLDFDSCYCSIGPRLFEDGAASKTSKRHSQWLQNSNNKYQGAEETDLFKNEVLSGEGKYLRMAFNSTLSSGEDVFNSFDNHPMFSSESASGEGNMGDSTFYLSDNIVYCYDCEEMQCPRPDENEELMRPSVLGDIVESKLYCELACLQEDFALNGFPVAVVNDSDIDQWSVGETRSYFVL